MLVKLSGEPSWHADSDSKLSAVALPLISGEPAWFRSSARYADYFEAVVWAMVLMERVDSAEESKVVPATNFRTTFRGQQERLQTRWCAGVSCPDRQPRGFSPGWAGAFFHACASAKPAAGEVPRRKFAGEACSD